MTMRGPELTIVLNAKDDVTKVLAKMEHQLADVTNATKQTTTATSGLGTAMGSLGKVVAVAGAAFAAIGVAKFATDTVKAASDVAEAQNKVNVVFKDGAGDINAFAKTAAQSLGLSRGAALDAAGTFGNLFTQLKIGGPAAATLSKQMITLAADFASFHNADITEVITAQTAAFRGEFDALQRFVPTINAAAVQQEAMAMTGKANEKALTEQDKALAVHSLMLKGAGEAAGDFTRTSDGMANATRIIGASFDDIQAAIGERLLPALAPLISSFAKGLPGAFDAVQKGLDLLGKGFDAFTSGGGFDTFYDSLITVFGPETAKIIADFIDPIAKFRAEVLPGLLDAMKPVADFAAGAFTKSVETLGAAISTASKLVQDLTTFLKANELAMDALNAVMLTFAAGGLLKVAIGLPPMIASVVAYTVAMAAAAVATVAAALPFIALAAVFGTVVLAGIEVAKNWDMLTMAAETMVRLIRLRFEELLGAFDAMMHAFFDVGDRIVQNIKDGISGAWDALTSWLGGKIRELMDAVGNALAGAGDALAGAGDALAGAKSGIGLQSIQMAGGGARAGVSPATAAAAAAAAGVLGMGTGTGAGAASLAERSFANAQELRGAASLLRKQAERSQRLGVAAAAGAFTRGGQGSDLESIAGQFGVRASDVADFLGRSGTPVSRATQGRLGMLRAGYTDESGADVILQVDGRELARTSQNSLRDGLNRVRIGG